VEEGEGNVVGELDLTATIKDLYGNLATVIPTDTYLLEAVVAVAGYQVRLSMVTRVIL